MDSITIRTKHTVASVTASGTFTTSSEKFTPLKDNVVLQLTHPSGVVEVATCEDVKKFVVTNTTRYFADDRGPKHTNAGSPWVGSVESGSDIKDIFADGTVILSPHEPSIIAGGLSSSNVGSLPGRSITLNREGDHINIVVTSTSTVADPVQFNATVMAPPPIPRSTHSPKAVGAQGVLKKRKRHRESNVSVPIEIPGLSNRELDLACSAIAGAPDGIELDFSDA